MASQEPETSRKTSFSSENTTDASIAAPKPASGTSKLVPAAPPAVNAWGSSTLLLSTKTDTNGNKEQKWPNTEAVLTKPATTNIVSSMKSTSYAKPKPSASASKSKLSGKEKWVPFEAEIRISANANNSDNNHRKSQSNSNGSNNNSSNGKKKNSNGQKSKSNHNQKKKDSSNGSKQDHNNQKNKKKENNNHSSSSNVNGTSTNENKSNSQKSPKPDSAKLDIETTTAKVENLKLPEETKTENLSNIHKEQPREKSHQHHRNSEPHTHSNNYKPNNHSRRHSNKQFNHESYGPSSYVTTTPFILPNSFNYGYPPFINGFPQTQFQYSYNTKPSRSNSHSPARNEFNGLVGGDQLIVTNPLITNVPPNFLPKSPLDNDSYPYVQDPLTLVINQLNYYFSPDNLAKDIYLRKQMNSKGLVPLKKLIEFNRLNKLTGGDISMLYTALNYTPFLELIDDKVRVREKWDAWILPVEQRDVSGKDEEVEEVK